MLLRYSVDGKPHYSLRYFAETKEEWTGFLRKVWGEEKGFPSFLAIAERIVIDSEVRQLENHTFWNFRAPVNPLHGVVIYPEAHGFLNVEETKNVANLILLASNLTGFSC